jgi:hypothetical protein
MRRQFYIIASIVLLSYNLVAQPDCIIIFKYVGNITSDSIKIDKIGLPTTPFLIGYINKNEERAFSIYKLKDSIVDKTKASHLSSHFCESNENIIDNVFKRSKNGYLIKVVTKKNDNSKDQKTIEILIPLESIKFTTEMVDNKREIKIDLGKIKI